ncbi:endonuclease domain-containing protein [Daejeonella lutea]|uniref:Very-short-patch-repair endonuclease n=1 Tax=Daejeonella lutea TaxID=572036 RepID=A0A1T5ETQ6_9SPHI|nr:endonuclease domain-containing protein [Daejeonella lutea]SKB87238.1 Very-short-patch-repair endonuclease [Daejeonella lutea]
MAPPKIHSVPYLRNRRSTLRNNPTPTEKYLWNYLKGKQLLGRKFRRQQSIGNYIVDFYCASERLVIELDGDVHSQPEQMTYDICRDEFLKKLGFKILRVKNELVYLNLPEVVRLIVERFD